MAQKTINLDKEIMCMNGLCEMVHKMIKKIGWAYAKIPIYDEL